jgi:hypothetical protein
LNKQLTMFTVTKEAPDIETETTSPISNPMLSTVGKGKTPGASKDEKKTIIPKPVSAAKRWGPIDLESYLFPPSSKTVILKGQKISDGGFDYVYKRNQGKSLDVAVETNDGNKLICTSHSKIKFTGDQFSMTSDNEICDGKIVEGTNPRYVKFNALFTISGTSQFKVVRKEKMRLPFSIGKTLYESYEQKPKRRSLDCIKTKASDKMPPMFGGGTLKYERWYCKGFGLVKKTLKRPGKRLLVHTINGW